MTFQHTLAHQERLEESVPRRRVRKRSRTYTICLTLLSGAYVGCSPPGAFSVAPPTLDGSLQPPAQGQSDQDDEDDPSLEHASLSNEVILGLLPDHAYRGEGFRLVNPEPFISTVSPTKTVSLWVSEAGYDSFTRIDPDDSGSLATVPEGTVIVREVLAAGVLETITVMAKLREGAFPLGGDFWYASADPDGSIRADDNGAPLAGLLQNCGTCHLRRDRDGFLFGAPADSLP